MPLQLYGRHSLEAYGYRLGEYKGKFVDCLQGAAAVDPVSFTEPLDFLIFESDNEKVLNTDRLDLILKFRHQTLKFN